MGKVGHVIQQVQKVAELSHHRIVEATGSKYMLIPADPAVIEVASLLPDSLAVPVMTYNHRSLKGDIDAKRSIIKGMANHFESRRDDLKAISSALCSELFFELNNLSIRHDNISPSSRHYKPHLANMGRDELEEWYDNTYRSCLEATLALDRFDRREALSKLKEDLQERL